MAQIAHTYVSLRLPVDLVERAESRATAEERSRSAVIRRALMEYIDRDDEKSDDTGKHHVAA